MYLANEEEFQKNALTALLVCTLVGGLLVGASELLGKSHASFALLAVVLAGAGVTKARRSLWGDWVQIGMVLVGGVIAAWFSGQRGLQVIGLSLLACGMTLGRGELKWWMALLLTASASFLAVRCGLLFSQIAMDWGATGFVTGGVMGLAFALPFIPALLPQYIQTSRSKSVQTFRICRQKGDSEEVEHLIERARVCWHHCQDELSAGSPVWEGLMSMEETLMTWRGAQKKVCHTTVIAERIENLEKRRNEACDEQAASHWDEAIASLQRQNRELETASSHAERQIAKMHRLVTSLEHIVFLKTGSSSAIL